MAGFPRTTIDGLAVSRMIVGTNWFLGYSHTSKAKGDLICKVMSAPLMAEILQVFLEAGVDTIMTPLWVDRGAQNTQLVEAMKIAQDRTGKKIIIIATPSLNIADTPAAWDENAKKFDLMKSLGASICMPHTSSTDALVEIRNRRILQMDRYCKMIRERGMVPGLSTHLPEAIVYADETGLDVGTYISIYNALGFLMNIEVDWVHKLIWSAKHPVITIKPMAAGRLLPLVGLAFSWSTIRPCDMVTVGTMSPDEARECIDISLGVLEGTGPQVELQRTRSKQSVEKKK